MDAEYGWLIELPRSINGIHEARWWAPAVGWTHDSTEAVRFCREEDAEAIIEFFKFDDAVATEHSWG